MALRIDDLNDFFDKDPDEETPEKQNDDSDAEEVAKTLKEDDDDDDADYITPSSQKRRKRIKIVVFALIAIAVALVTVKALLWGKVADEGKVRCYIISLEKRDGIFNSYEGQMIEEGTLDEYDFSTTSQEVGKRIYNALNTDSLFVLTYTKYNNRMPWRGETTFIVNDAETAPAHPLDKPKKGKKK